MSAPLIFENVWVGYGKRVALCAMTTAFAAGAVTGLVGPNGAGKTTLLRAALGRLPVARGSVRVLARPLTNWPREALARTIAYLPQDAQTHWPVRANILVALGRIPHRQPFAPLSAEDISAVDNALERCDARPFADRRMDELSLGERARVLLARALATRAAILLVDEPAAHLDPAHQLRLMELLREEAARGAAVVVTLHDLALAARFCDAMIVLKGGALVAEGNPYETLSDAVLGEAFGIRAWQAAAFPSHLPPIVPWQRL
ncbi:MAG: ABC transporter ATP-binding protein [Rhizomicrobium sp.]